MLLKARDEGSQLDVEGIIRMNTDALALLGHISFEISQRRRDVIRPTLNKDYSTLCASHVPITTMLFGDELQPQLNQIRASNKISSTASTSTLANKRPYNTNYKSQTPTRQWRPFLDKAPQGNQSNKKPTRYQYNHWKKRPNQATDQK